MAARRRSVPRVLLVVSVLIFAAIVAFGAVGYARQRELVRRQLEENGRKAALVLNRMEDILRRHPDFGFEKERAQVASYRALAPRELGKALPQVEALQAALSAAAVSRATGRKPGEPGWEELLAFKTFSPNGFRLFYESMTYERIHPLAEVPSITGDAGADARIARLATDRGYRLRPLAESAALAAEGRGQLQEPALKAFRAMRAQARAEGVRLELVSGFRSLSRQRAIFLAALNLQAVRRSERPYTAEQIASGQADEAIEAVLRESAPPGFSRHHAGYCLDLNDPSTGKDFTEFADSPAFLWLSADNYRNAKRFGFIPSYPNGAAEQGPEPEPWEYVWVGEDRLRNP